MNTQKQTRTERVRNQLGRFMGPKRKLLLLRERKYGKYRVRTFQREMTPVERLQWLTHVANVMRDAIGTKPTDKSE